mmetsp:Transcript_81880/g.210948  ORF Transcript_81880/g.210948 Transcript_81880/m.210948 type:complete len:219 (-) Transcript_81880:422-1078(-)
MKTAMMTWTTENPIVNLYIRKKSAHHSFTEFMSSRQCGPQLASVTSNMVSTERVKDPQASNTWVRLTTSTSSSRMKGSSSWLTIMAITVMTRTIRSKDQKSTARLARMDLTIRIRGSKIASQRRMRRSRRSRAMRASRNIMGSRIRVSLQLTTQMSTITASYKFHHVSLRNLPRSVASLRSTSSVKRKPKIHSKVRKVSTAPGHTSWAGPVDDPYPRM